MVADICEVTVENTGEQYICPYDTALLDAALAAGIHMPHNCRGGACGTCKAKLLEGEVDHGWVMSFAISDEEKAAGYCLCCQSKPRSARIRLQMEHAMTARQANEDRIVPAEITTTILSAHTVTPSVLRLVVALPQAMRFHYHAGMDMEFLLPDIEAPRPYSIADAPTPEGAAPDGQLTFYIARYPEGRSSTWLHENAKPGEPLLLRGPYGDVRFPAGHAGPVLCLAGGTGLSPILSGINFALAQGFPHPVRVIFSVRERREIFALDDLVRVSRRYPNFGWQVTLTRDPEAPETWAKGRIPDLLAKEAPDLSPCAAMIAGSPAFVDACAESLKQHKVDPDKIVIDSFLPRSQSLPSR